MGVNPGAHGIQLPRYSGHGEKPSVSKLQIVIRKRYVNNKRIRTNRNEKSK